MPHLGGPEMNFQGIGNNKVAFVSRGAGPSLVLIHGLGQDHRIWAEIQPALPEYTTIAYDLRGHGQTPVGDAAGTLAQLGDDLIAFLAATGPAVCIGFSLGGVIALWAASARPDLVKGGTVVGSTDEFGFKAEQNPVHVHDLHATMLHLLGMDHEKLTYRYAGRDFRLTDVHGNLVKEIIA